MRAPVLRPLLKDRSHETSPLMSSRSSILSTPALLALMGLALAACDVETLRIEVCTGQLAVLVSSEPGAEFSWSGGCGVGDLTVREAGPAGTMVWHLQDPQGTNRLTPPIRYGQVPPGAEQVVEAAPLAVGTQYVVEVRALRRLAGRSVESRLGEGRFVR